MTGSKSVVERGQESEKDRREKSQRGVRKLLEVMKMFLILNGQTTISYCMAQGTISNLLG